MQLQPWKWWALLVLTLLGQSFPLDTEMAEDRAWTVAACAFGRGAVAVVLRNLVQESKTQNPKDVYEGIVSKRQNYQW